MQRNAVLQRRAGHGARPSAAPVTHAHVHDHAFHVHPERESEEYINRLVRHEHPHRHDAGEHGHDAADVKREPAPERVPVAAGHRGH